MGYYYFKVCLSLLFVCRLLSFSRKYPKSTKGVWKFTKTIQTYSRSIQLIFNHFREIAHLYLTFHLFILNSVNVPWRRNAWYRGELEWTQVKSINMGLKRLKVRRNRENIRGTKFEHSGDNVAGEMVSLGCLTKDSGRMQTNILLLC